MVNHPPTYVDDIVILVHSFYDIVILVHSFFDFDKQLKIIKIKVL
jgi:hypothetical protein